MIHSRLILSDLNGILVWQNLKFLQIYNHPWSIHKCQLNQPEIQRLYANRRSINRVSIDFNLEDHILLIEYTSLNLKFGTLYYNPNYSVLQHCVRFSLNAVVVQCDSDLNFSCFCAVEKSYSNSAPPLLWWICLMIYGTHTTICAYLKHLRRKDSGDHILIQGGLKHKHSLLQLCRTTIFICKKLPCKTWTGITSCVIFTNADESTCPLVKRAPFCILYTEKMPQKRQQNLNQFSQCRA